MPDYSDLWSYTITTESAMIKEITGIDLSDLGGGVLQKVPIYLWRGHDNYDLEDVPFKKMFPYITVTGFPTEYASGDSRGSIENGEFHWK